MKIPIFQVDAFSSQCFSGNPAAVCILDSWLPTETLQAIAQENNLSETAFVVGSGQRYEIRWFTPMSEVDLCGHATLATTFVLFHELGVEGDVLFFESRSGELQVKREKNRLELNFPKDSFKAISGVSALDEAFGVPCSEVYLGKTDYMVVLENENILRSLKPNFYLLGALDVRGIIVTAPGDEVDFVSRFFAPREGINEDPVTGSAHTTLTPYWASRLGKTAMTALQISARGGKLHCTLDGSRVKISGEGVLYLKGEISIPD
jgi:PhzF family phenazine biosynthesis protein